MTIEYRPATKEDAELGYQSCWYVSCRLVLLKMNQLFLIKRHLSREPGSMDLIKSNFRVSLLV